jgi:riboflavin biosynthesis pyrimidine reductase
VSAADEAVRVGRGQDAQPRIAVVSGSLRLDWSSPFFTEAHARPAVVTTSAAVASAPDAARAVAEFVAVGEERVDLAAALAVFADEGARTVLVEGGPGVNGDLARARLIDELCLTVSPRVVGGEGARIMAGPPFDPPFAPVVGHILEEDGFLFLRMSLREAPEPPDA